jgi:hypothetical protein
MFLNDDISFAPLVMSHIYETVTTFGELEVFGRECSSFFQSKETSEKVKPQSLLPLSCLRFKLATLRIQVPKITVGANLLVIMRQDYMLMRDGIMETSLYNKGLSNLYYYGSVF